MGRGGGGCLLGTNGIEAQLWANITHKNAWPHFVRLCIPNLEQERLHPTVLATDSQASVHNSMCGKLW